MWCDGTDKSSLSLPSTVVYVLLHEVTVFWRLAIVEFFIRLQKL